MFYSINTDKCRYFWGDIQLETENFSIFIPLGIYAPVLSGLFVLNCGVVLGLLRYRKYYIICSIWLLAYACWGVVCRSMILVISAPARVACI